MTGLVDVRGSRAGRAPRAAQRDDPAGGPGLLRCTVQAREEATVVEVDGALGRHGAALLREALREGVAEAPPALIVDLAGVVVLDEAVLSVFPAVVLGAQWWAGTELMLAAPSVSVRAVLSRRRVLFGRCFDTREEALAAAAAGPGARRFREHLRAGVGAGWQARRLIDQACATWGLVELVDPARLVATELVGNAVRHAGTDIGLSVARHAGWVRVGVRDGSREPPRLYGPSHPHPGRPQGLLRVQDATTDWGVTELTDGKIVWANWHTGGPVRWHRTGRSR